MAAKKHGSVLPCESRYPPVWRQNRRPLLQLNLDGQRNRNGQRNRAAPLNPDVNQNRNVRRNLDVNQSRNGPLNPGGPLNPAVKRNHNAPRNRAPRNRAARRNLDDQWKHDARSNPNAHANDKKNPWAKHLRK